METKTTDTIIAEITRQIITIDHSFSSLEEDYNDRKKKFQESFENNPIYTLHWNMEEMVKAQASYEVSMGGMNWWKAIKELIIEGVSYKGKTEEINALVDKLAEYKEWQAWEKNQMLSNTPSFGSSSNSSNYIDLLKYQTKAGMFSGNISRGFFSSMELAIQKVISLIKELKTAPVTQQ